MVAEPLPQPADGSPPELVPAPRAGRTHAGRRRVQPEETTPGGRLRLDAMARYLADVAGDDVEDAALEDPGVWLVRRTEIRVLRPPVLGEEVELVTFCSGTGPRWAQRRTSLRGGRGGEAEAASLWVYVDPVAGRPAQLTQSFLACYGPSAAGRRVRARLEHPEAPGELGDGVPGRPFALRASDFDANRHVNNAVAWEMVEDEVARVAPPAGPQPWPWRAEVEYRAPIGMEVREVGLVADGGGEGPLWIWVVAGGRTRVTARVWLRDGVARRL